MTQPQTLVTVDEFWEQYSTKKFPSFELVEGELVEMSPPGGIHGEIAAYFAAVLMPYVRQNRLGRVMVETGYRLEHEPDTVRAPDVSFISTDRVPSDGLPRGYVEGVPDLAVEVVSPYDLASEVEGKVHDYLRNGTRRVWVVYSSLLRVVSYSSDGSVRWYHEGDSLEDQDLLPGFSLNISELFAQ